jgi:hypothetical protein
MILNGFFPMMIVNVGTILVAIPQSVNASTFAQNLGNSITVSPSDEPRRRRGSPKCVLVLPIPLKK